MCPYALYGPLSHRDDVINNCRGSPFICWRVKTEWVCAPLSQTESSMQITGCVAIGGADTYSNEERERFRKLWNGHAGLAEIAKWELGTRDQTSSWNRRNRAQTKALTAASEHQRKIGSIRRERLGERKSEREIGRERLQATVKETEREQEQKTEQDTADSDFIPAYYWSHWKASCVSTMGKSGKWKLHLENFNFDCSSSLS